METEIQKFYSGKCIFLTGGTGCLGKVLLEKILRVTRAKVYILVRPKNDATISQRMTKLLEEPVFDNLRKLEPSLDERVVPLQGDASLPDLGLSKENYELLERKVDIIIHGAATLRFNDPLSKALKINTRGTLEIIKLAKKIQNLKALVHLSTAFVNFHRVHFDEHPLNEENVPEPEKICELLECLGDESINKMEAHFRGNFPNTYIFAKTLGEIAVHQNSDVLPVCIFRPAIITPTIKEPLVGWTGNYGGPVAILSIWAQGLLRVFLTNETTIASAVPLDYCVNLTIVLAWQAAESHRKSTTPPPPKIYNLVPDCTNSICIGEMTRLVGVHGRNMPLSKMLWFPILINTNSKLVFKLLTFALHTLPALLMDFAALLSGGKTRWMQIYRRIQEKNMELYHFISKPWTYSMENTEALWQTLSKSDQEIFPFKMSEVNWSTYIANSLVGLRQYLAGESDSTIPAALKSLKRLKLIHQLMKASLVAVGFGVMWWLKAIS